MKEDTMTKGFPLSPSYGAIGKAHDDLAAKASDTVKDKVVEVKDKVVEVKDKVVEVKDKVIELKDQVVESGESTLASLKRFVKARPLTAVVLAFGLGYVGMRVLRPLRWL